MRTRKRNIWLILHFGLLFIVVSNSIVKKISNYGLVVYVEFGIELLTVLTGFIMFLIYVKPFRKISLYFSMYALAIIISLVALIFRGIIGALVLSVMLFPIIPDQTMYEQNGVIITSPFEGLISSCCTYQVKERKNFLFEKNYGVLKYKREGPINFESINIEKLDNRIKFTYSTQIDEENMKMIIIER